MSGRITLKVFRYNPAKDEEPHYDTYEVPFVEGARVLDLLNYVKENLDSTLAYRWECRAGQCGSCAMMVNGKAALACQTLVSPEDKEITLEPLPIFPVIKDLVVDVEKGVKKILKARPYVHRGSPYKRPEIVYSWEIEEVKPLRECIECWCCISMCPVVKVAWDVYGGPIVMNSVAKVALDRRNVFDHVLLAYLDGLNACTQCAMCYEVCPKEIEIPEKAVGRMRYIAYNKRNLIRPDHRLIVESMKRDYNPLMEPAMSRANCFGEWAGLPALDTPIAREDAEILYFVGCMASWREQAVARATATLLKLVGANFTVLGPYEHDCGSVLFRLGDLELARSFALYMKNSLKRYNKIHTIVTSCAGCYRTFKRDYPEKLGIDLGAQILHSSELFNQYLKDGKLNIREELNLRATYHDPCHLGRHVGVFDPPREIIKVIGVDLQEMLNGRYRDKSLCCGAGGGVRSGFREVAREVAAYRIRMDVPKEVPMTVHACPFCHFNFEDAVKTKGFKLINVDLTELLLTAVMGPDASKVIGKERYETIIHLSHRQR
ncbi:MAG: 2Fe-2S iron-sulfur cluster-binding protein [Candidatus Nezhaarchaeota archaeon]|nr:2Fe-2S iron-sulfur cluster-binding protein [Candidatus Nezhaarchaeota archaeon]MCX8141611.1 2Fe-2S iron-sulfur cluster-binding protein [Candidatus Nezhaarchaeota archaeon]MDW8049878.1 2Fe-2S iron-sulfur cluster-binding protein [Nitrososphaerota archaeon]